jgi:hypothetical protein
MKRSTLILASVLPLVCAAISAAQIAPLRLSVPVNPVAGLPKLLPSPLGAPLAGTRIELPGLVPSLTPSPALLAAAAPAAILPVSLPTRRAPMALPTLPSHENVINPLRTIMPGVTIRFGEKAKGEKAAPDAVRDNLDQLFDGDGQSTKPGVDRGPIGNERRISLPEDDLMRELGI